MKKLVFRGAITFLLGVKMKLRCLIPILCVLILAILFSCNKNEPEVGVSGGTETAPSQGIDERVARYKTSIYSDKDQKKGSWLTTINKGSEKVTVLEEGPHSLNGEEVILALVELSDGTKGYTRSDNLARKAIVITEESVMAYNRNNEGSGVKVTLPFGALAFVIDEKANWVKATYCILEDGSKVYNFWLSEGFTDDAETVRDAVIIENARNVLRGTAKGEVDQEEKSLQVIADGGGALQALAQSVLDGGSGAAYEYPEGLELATTTTGINMRSDASLEADKVTVVPEGKSVAIIEVKDELIEINGNEGSWTKINYNGTEGWVFGAHLQKP